MKLLNKKGMTLIEIILSIGLVSIVMVQVLNILVDLKDEQLLGKDKTADLTNRSIIVKTVQDRFNTKIVKNLNNCKKTNSAESTRVKNYLQNMGYNNILSCVEIIYSGGDIDLMFTARKDGIDHFIFGKYNDTSIYVFESWPLKSGTYPTNSGCGLTVTNSCTANPTEITDCSIYNYFSINYPVEVSKNIKKTTMNFDLEFLYYYKKSATNKLTIDSNLNSCKI